MPGAARSTPAARRSPPELASRLADVPWIRAGEPEAALLAACSRISASCVASRRWARQQVRAEQRFFTHARRPARVSAQRRARVAGRPLGAEVAESCMPQSVFAGMTGEVCVHAEPGHGELVVLLHGRELERLSYDAQLGFEVVIDTERATPADRYRGLAARRALHRDRAGDARGRRACDRDARRPRGFRQRPDRPGARALGDAARARARRHRARSARARGGLADAHRRSRLDRGPARAARRRGGLAARAVARAARAARP